MKIIVSGATGFVAAEVLRHAAQMPEITTILALARKPVQFTGPGAEKVKSVIVGNYDEYSDDVKKELAGADACIWTVAVTPGKAQSMDPVELKRICHDFTLAGLKAIVDAGPAKPFRFIYMSGSINVRDPAKKPFFLGSYAVMRGAVENDVLAFAKEHGIEACVAKPGFISTGSVLGNAAGVLVKMTGLAPSATVTQVAKAMLHQVVNGFEKEPLLGEDLVRLGS